MKNAIKKVRNEVELFFSFVLFIVKLGFYNQSVAQKIVKARRCVTFTTGNPNFVTPNPPLADITVAADALEAAEEQMDGSQAKTIARNLRLKELTKLMVQFTAYVENISNGDKEVALSSGLYLRDEPNPLGFLVPPSGLKGKNAPVFGAVDLHWNNVPKNSGYLVEWTSDPNQVDWPNHLPVEKASARIHNLIPGERYYFRVATLTHDGWEGYSTVITLRINFND